jgi:hypothetical protein
MRTRFFWPPLRKVHSLRAWLTFLGGSWSQGFCANQQSAAANAITQRWIRRGGISLSDDLPGRLSRIAW